MDAISSLRADLYNVPAIPTSESLPDHLVGLWQSTVVTLISGQSKAVLVDTLFTSNQAVFLGDWIQETLNGKILTTIYITHGHGDHWFDFPYLTRRFPGVQVVSTQESMAHMETQLTPEYRALWNGLFPRQIANESFTALAKPVKDNKFTLEGHTLEAVNVGHSDTNTTTFLHVPSLNMSVAVILCPRTGDFPRSFHINMIRSFKVIRNNSSRLPSSFSVVYDEAISVI